MDDAVAVALVVGACRARSLHMKASRAELRMRRKMCEIGHGEAVSCKPAVARASQPAGAHGSVC